MYVVINEFCSNWLGRFYGNNKLIRFQDEMQACGIIA
jgi:hypothetical protein